MRFERFVFKNQTARELLIGLRNTNCTNYTNMLLENEKNRKFLKIREISEISV